jgi:hypothetical protein
MSFTCKEGEELLLTSFSSSFCPYKVADEGADWTMCVSILELLLSFFSLKENLSFIFVTKSQSNI